MCLEFAKIGCSVVVVDKDDETLYSGSATLQQLAGERLLLLLLLPFLLLLRTQ